MMSTLSNAFIMSSTHINEYIEQHTNIEQIKQCKYGAPRATHKYRAHQAAQISNTISNTQILSALSNTNIEQTEQHKYRVH